MNKHIDRVIDIAAYILGTALDISDQAREYVPSILQMLANLASLASHLASHLANLATCLVSCVALGYTALKPVCVAQGRAGARFAKHVGTLVRLNAPLVLNRLYDALRACMDLVKESQRLVKEQVKGQVREQVREQVKRLQAYAIAAWQFRKECLA